MIRSHQRITILLAILLVGPACKTRDSYYCEGAPNDNCSLIDAAIDTEIDACVTFSTQLDTCMLVTGTDPMITSGKWIYDTDKHVLKDGGGNEVSVMHAPVTNGDVMDVIVANNFTLAPDATLQVVGSVAFGIVATGTITIDGTIDAVGSDPMATSMLEAAGARQTMGCIGMDAQNNTTGGPGGGGAGFSSVGGNGGRGDNGGMPVSGAMGGMREDEPSGFPRGGCHGGKGGDGAANTGGKAGRGGGAVDLISAVSIKIDGHVNAGGSGGLGGGSILPLVGGLGGGGGGGSGGMIVLEAPMIDVMGSVTANGGGGGGGAGATNPGARGGDGREDSMQARGGTKGDSGSDGGRGGAKPTIGEAAMQANDGGGGGGGAAGYIRILGDQTPMLSVISPAPLP